MTVSTMPCRSPRRVAVTDHRRFLHLHHSRSPTTGIARPMTPTTVSQAVHGRGPPTATTARGSRSSTRLRTRYRTIDLDTDRSNGTARSESRTIDRQHPTSRSSAPGTPRASSPTESSSTRLIPHLRSIGFCRTRRRCTRPAESEVAVTSSRPDERRSTEPSRSTVRSQSRTTPASTNTTIPTRPRPTATATSTATPPPLTTSTVRDTTSSGSTSSASRITGATTNSERRSGRASPARSSSAGLLWATISVGVEVVSDRRGPSTPRPSGSGTAAAVRRPRSPVRSSTPGTVDLVASARLLSASATSRRTAWISNSTPEDPAVSTETCTSPTRRWSSFWSIVTLCTRVRGIVRRWTDTTPRVTISSSPSTRKVNRHHAATDAPASAATATDRSRTRPRSRPAPPRNATASTTLTAPMFRSSFSAMNTSAIGD